MLNGKSYNICSQEIEEGIWNLLVNSGVKKTYDKGESVFKKGDISNGLICLTKGKVKVFNTSLEGKEKIFGILVSPALFGETETLDRGLRMVCATAISDIEIVAISGNKTKELIYSYPEIALYIIRSIGIKLRWTTVQAEDLSMHKTKHRLARLLLDFEKYGIFTCEDNNNCLNITHEQLASFIGTARPKVTTYLNEFVLKELIKTERGRITIVDLDGLKKYAYEDDG